MVPLLQLSNFRKLSLQLSIQFKKKTALIEIMSESNVIILRKDANLNDIKDIVDTEVTKHHSQIIIGSLKSEKHFLFQRMHII